MSLTRRVYGGKKSRNSKKGRGHCRIGGKKTLKKGGKRVLSLGGKSPKNRKKSKRRSKRGGEVAGRTVDKVLRAPGPQNYIVELAPSDVEGAIRYEPSTKDPMRLLQLSSDETFEWGLRPALLRHRP